MSPEQQSTVMETVEVLMAEACSTNDSVDSSVGDDLVLDDDGPIDLTDETPSLPLVDTDFQDELDDTQADDGDQGIAQSLIDGALRRASDIFSESRGRADEVVEDAHNRALVIVSGAEDFADELLCWARADAEEQVEEIFERSRAKTSRMIEAADATIEEKETLAKETLAAVTALADSRIADAEKSAAAILRQAKLDAVVVHDQAEQEARILLLTSQAEGDRRVTDAQAQADEILASVEELRATAHARLSAAAGAAAERGRASARKQIDAQLIDTRREIEELEAQAVAIRQELADAAQDTESPVVSIAA